MGDVHHLPRCFVTGERIVLPEAATRAVALGRPVLLSPEGKSAMQQFQQSGNLSDLPDGPAREAFAQLDLMQQTQALVQGLQWLSEYPGARLEFCPQGGVLVSLPDGLKAVGHTVLDALVKLMARKKETEA